MSHLSYDNQVIVLVLAGVVLVAWQIIDAALRSRE